MVQVDDKFYKELEALQTFRPDPLEIKGRLARYLADPGSAGFYKAQGLLERRGLQHRHYMHPLWHRVVRGKFVAYSWIHITSSMIFWILDHCIRNNIRDVLEIGSGNGLLVAFLNHPYIQGVYEERHGWAPKFVATDLTPGNGGDVDDCYAEVEPLDATAAVKKYPDYAVMCVWAARGSNFVSEALKHTKSPHLLLIDEGGGCTGCPEMYEYVDDMYDDVSTFGQYQKWPDMHDTPRWYALKGHKVVPPPVDDSDWDTPDTDFED